MKCGERKKLSKVDGKTAFATKNNVEKEVQIAQLGIDSEIIWAALFEKTILRRLEYE